MAKIIAIGNQKGGTGKTTVTCLLSNALSAPPFNLRVYVADCDPQQSIIKRRRQDHDDDTPPPYPVAYFETFGLLQHEIKELDEQNDVVFLDLPGRLDAAKDGTLYFLHLVDLLLIPFAPGNYALESTIDYLKIAVKIRDRRKASGRPMQVVGFVNFFEGGRTVDDRWLLKELAELQKITGIEIMKNNLQKYAIFRAVDTFTSLYNNHSNDRATVNFSNFVDEFKTLIK